MAIKRVDVEEDDSDQIGWGWEDCDGNSECLTVYHDCLEFKSPAAPSGLMIYRDDIQHWIKALSEAQNYFNA